MAINLKRTQIGTLLFIIINYYETINISNKHKGKCFVWG